MRYRQGILLNRRGIGRTTAPGVDYFLDQYPGARAAFSSHVQLSSTYSGACFTVERADTTQSGIGFNAQGIYDQNAENLFCAGTQGVTATWHDQSGLGKDLPPSGTVLSTNASGISLATQYSNTDAPVKYVTGRFLAGAGIEHLVGTVQGYSIFFLIARNGSQEAYLRIRKWHGQEIQCHFRGLVNGKQEISHKRSSNSHTLYGNNSYYYDVTKLQAIGFTQDVATNTPYVMHAAQTGNNLANNGWNINAYTMNFDTSYTEFMTTSQNLIGLLVYPGDDYTSPATAKQLIMDFAAAHGVNNNNSGFA